MTYLCVAIFVNDLAQAKRDIAQAAEAGADLVELRIDTFTQPQEVRELVRSAIVPVIVTCRPEWEGGNSEASDSERLATLATAMEENPRYVDVELVTLMRNRDAIPNWPMIVSSHDFEGRPARLSNLLIDLNNCPAQVSKIVWTARSIRDNLEAFEILKSRSKPTIAICMGEAGMISRILAKKFDAFLTFASLTAGNTTAAGQVPIADMKNLYRWDALSAKTKVYGVVAQPVMHSMSPAIHNAAFGEVGHDGIYLPLLVEGSYESFKAFMETFLSFEGMDLSGLSITIPHKENALRYLKENNAKIEPLAESIGAVNTIIIERGSGEVNLSGMNTDYAAILDSITEALKITRQELAQKKVGVLGAGGTGRTAVAALRAFGANVLIANRTVEKAQDLAKEFSATAMSLDELAKNPCDIYINTTSVGMYPKVDEMPIDPKAIPKSALFFDTIYNPMKTKLLRELEQRGNKTIPGIEMFVRQAAGQFQAWTKKNAPVDLMRRVISDRLSK